MLESSERNRTNVTDNFHEDFSNLGGGADIVLSLIPLKRAHWGCDDSEVMTTRFINFTKILHIHYRLRHNLTI
jgi:hypothetical protein